MISNTCNEHLTAFPTTTSFLRKFIFLLFCLLFSSQLVVAAEYKVAVRAHRGIDAAVKLWQPTMDYLSQAIPEHRFILKPVLGLDELTVRVGAKEFDFVLTNPSSFVEIEYLHGATALVTLNNKRANTAQREFGSVVFTHVKHLDILSIKDLKGKTLMAVSKPAFGGWRVAWLEMLDQGFDPITGLKSLIFAKSRAQHEVVFAVRDGIADAGVVRTDMLERMEASGKIDMRYFRILNNKEVKNFPFFLSTKLYPEWAFASLKHVPKKHAQQVTKALMAIENDTAASKAGKYVGWIKPMDYQPVRELMQRLKVGPYAVGN